MDTFTRNYSIALGILVIGLVFLFTSEDPAVTELNDLLHADTALASYPYRFRVLQIENNVATMTTPRSADFPAYKALGLIYPALAGLPQDDPRLMEGQLEMAQLQEYARELVIGTGHVGHVTWQLDQAWLDGNGVTIMPMR